MAYCSSKFFVSLKAHREVFEYLIEDFKTYKPLLSGIKNEYEMMLSYQRELIRQMEPLKVKSNVIHAKLIIPRSLFIR